MGKKLSKKLKKKIISAFAEATYSKEVASAMAEDPDHFTDVIPNYVAPSEELELCDYVGRCHIGIGTRFGFKISRSDFTEIYCRDFKFRDMYDRYTKSNYKNALKPKFYVNDDGNLEYSTYFKRDDGVKLSENTLKLLYESMSSYYYKEVQIDMLKDDPSVMTVPHNRFVSTTYTL